MRRDEIADLAAFVVVAEEKSFTKAARRLGIAQSALSQIVRRTEARLNVRLLSRTTRSVAPTEAGERLMATLGPMLHDLDKAIASLDEVRDRPMGTIRITTVEHAAKMFLLPAMKRLLRQYPDIKVEITVDYGMADVVSERFDAGVRLGGDVAKDMISARISPNVGMAIVGSPDYFEAHPAPQFPGQLVDHRAVNLRLPTSGEINSWRLVKNGNETKIKVEGQVVLNTIDLILDAAVNGHGLAYLPRDQVEANIRSGKLVQVLSRFTPDLPAYHIYYANRRHASAAFTAFLEAVRFRS